MEKWIVTEKSVYSACCTFAVKLLLFLFQLTIYDTVLQITLSVNTAETGMASAEISMWKNTSTGVSSIIIVYNGFSVTKNGLYYQLQIPVVKIKSIFNGLWSNFLVIK